MIVNGKKTQGAVVWLTGLSGSGKSTLADRLFACYLAEGYAVEKLDGDAVRAVFPQTGFSKEERDEHVRRIGFIASLLEKHGVIVIASFISPYREARGEARRMCRRFVEVFVATSLAECERRDVKGLYAKARKGEIQKFTGITDPYEAPQNPEIVIHTDGKTIDQSFEELKVQMNRFIKEDE